MNSLVSVFSLSADLDSLTLLQIRLPGPAVHKEAARGAVVPADQKDLLQRVLSEDENAQVLICRIIGMPDTDPRHKVVLFAPEQDVPIFGMTI